jgi:dTDP-4-dehydrorhamnose 3,5-epimerase
MVTPLKLKGPLLLLPERHGDGRGHFVEVWNKRRFEEHGLTFNFVQDNQSYNRSAGTVCGLHFQAPPSAQAKLVGVLRGRIFDVVVDLREASPTFAQWAAVELSAEKGEHLMIPRGFAHGYCTLEDDTLVSYKVDDYYDRAREAGLRWNDPMLGIAWPALGREPQLSARDASLPGFSDFVTPFTSAELV